MRSAEISRRREEREQRKKDKEMERVARLQHEEEERREAERKAREALAVQRREERKVARQVRLLSHKCKSNIHHTCALCHYEKEDLAHQGEFLGLLSSHETSATE